MRLKNESLIPFSAYTDNGNEYEKSKIGKLSGLAAGAGLSGFKLIKNHKAGFDDEFINQAKKEKIDADSAKTLLRGSKVLFVIFTIGLTLGIGAIVDAIINKTRRNKVDENSEALSIKDESNKNTEIE